jgi:hypothetical protein
MTSGPSGLTQIPPHKSTCSALFHFIPGDWESFKREFNHDVDELGQALKDLTVDNEQ